MAERTDIAAELNALAVHCPPRLMEVEQRALWLRDWCEDLAEFPIDAIRQACRKYRHSGATKFPTPGQLVPMVNAAMPAEHRERESVWRPLSDAEYEALSLRDKIRHQLILAHEAGLKAGPMFRNTSVPGQPITRAKGEHLTLEDMPDTYKRWKGIQSNHLAEAKRLREYLRTPMAAE